MSVEQVARDFITKMTDARATEGMLTANATASGGLLPQSMPAMEAFKMMDGLNSAFPDLKFEVQQVTVNGNQATVKAKVSGTHTGPFAVPVPGMPSIPATGKKVSMQDAYVITVQGDKVSHMQIDLPADGGLPAILMQLGVKMPQM